MPSCCSLSTAFRRSTYKATSRVYPYDMPTMTLERKDDDDAIGDVERLQHHDGRGAIDLEASQHLHGWRCS